MDLNNPAIKLNYASSIENIAFYYPNQTWDNTNSCPEYAYPASIQIQTGAKRILIENVFFMNSYDAIDATAHHEILVIKNVQGYAIRYGLNCDSSTDVDRYSTVHFNPNAWTITAPSSTDIDNIAKWTRKNGTAFIFQRLDGANCNDIFAWGYRIGVNIVNSVNGYVIGFLLSNSMFDGVW